MAPLLLTAPSTHEVWLWHHCCCPLPPLSPLAARYSDKYPFRMRSETPDIAIELSMQPLRAFRPDGIIFFSDILTPLPGGRGWGRNHPHAHDGEGCVCGVLYQENSGTATCRGIVAVPHP